MVCPVVFRDDTEKLPKAYDANWSVWQPPWFVLRGAFMALVVFLRGVNVGGHKAFRPSDLARQLADFDAVNVGAAGTFVIRKTIGQAALRAALLKRLPFQAELMICSGRDVGQLAAAEPFAGEPA